MRAERVGPEDWQAWRALRLEALQDTPIGYVRTYEESARLAEQDWRGWLSSPGAFWLLPGTAMAGVWEDGGRCWLGAVYVAPTARGGGLLDDLVASAAQWARERGHEELALEVHEDNVRAQAAYARRGFRPTGARRPYPLDPLREELEMVLAL